MKLIIQKKLINRCLHQLFKKLQKIKTLSVIISMLSHTKNKNFLNKFINLKLNRIYK